MPDRPSLPDCLARFGVSSTDGSDADGGLGQPSAFSWQDAEWQGAWQDEVGHTLLRLQPIHAMDTTLLGAEATSCELPAFPLFGIESCVEAPELVRCRLRLACSEAADWARLAGESGALTVSVRLPASSLCDWTLVAWVEAALVDTGLSPRLLEIGLDAAGLQDLSADTLLAMSALRDHGIGLALGDFGSAPVMLGQLHRLPLTCLRLHAGMVPHLSCSRDARRAVGDAIRAAHAQNMQVVATGVRNALQRDLLAEFGCDAAQGPLFGHPMMAEAFHAALV